MAAGQIAFARLESSYNRLTRRRVIQFPTPYIEVTRIKKNWNNRCVGIYDIYNSGYTYNIYNISII